MSAVFTENLTLFIVGGRKITLIAPLHSKVSAETFWIYFLTFRFWSIPAWNFKCLFRYRLSRNQTLDFTGFQHNLPELIVPKINFIQKVLHFKYFSHSSYQNRNSASVPVSGLIIRFRSYPIDDNTPMQAGAELCQAQEKLGIAKPALPRKRVLRHVFYNLTLSRVKYKLGQSCTKLRLSWGLLC
jgi:hypothetical protein